MHKMLVLTFKPTERIKRVAFDLIEEIKSHAILVIVVANYISLEKASWKYPDYLKFKVRSKI